MSLPFCLLKRIRMTCQSQIPEVESMINHCRLKEAMHTPALSEQEFTMVNSTDAYIQAARDGLARIIQLFLKKIQVKFVTI